MGPKLGGQLAGPPSVHSLVNERHRMTNVGRATRVTMSLTPGASPSMRGASYRTS